MTWPTLAAAVAGLGLGIGLVTGTPVTTAAPVTVAALKAVVHINFADAERQGHGLKNIRNMLDEAGESAVVVVECHGGGIGLVVKDQTRHGDEVAKLLAAGVRFDACENTMRDKAIPRDALLPGVTTVPSGAVAVVRLQQDGFGCFRP